MNSKVLSYWKDDVKMTSKVQPVAGYWAPYRENLWTRVCYFWRAEKERNREPRRTGKNFIEDITRWREDMNFIFEWQNNILRTSVASFCVFDDFLKISEVFPKLFRSVFLRFWWFSEDFRPPSEDFRSFSKIIPNTRRKFPNIFREFPKISEDIRRFQKIAEDFRGRPEDVSMIHQGI